MFTFLGESHKAMKNILIVGATSAIAVACARVWATEKARFFLVGRNETKLSQVSADLSARGASAVHTYLLDLNQLDGHSAMIQACYETLDQVELALIAHGTLPNQSACEQDSNLAIKAFSNNSTNTIALLTLLANRLEQHGNATLAVISSVAGDRGRPSNYLYGAAKVAVSTFCEGLRARLFKKNVHVLTIKPGFVETPMTQGLQLPKILLSTPEKVAKDITYAIEKRKDVLYTPFFWRWIMMVIRLIPQCIFKRLNF